jgi:predicted dehydrogenase
VKIAIIGTGSAGSQHLAVVESLDGVVPVAVPRRLSRIAEIEAAGFATASDIHSAASAGAHAAIIATDTARHVADAYSALSEGLDVLVEKPLAVDSVVAQGVLDKANELGKKVYVACVLRFSESLNTFQELLPKIGQLHSVRVVCGSYLPDWRPNRPYFDSYSARANEGGVLRDLVHEIDYTGWIFGWPSLLSASLKNTGRLKIDGEEIADLRWGTPDGCLVSVSLDFLSKPARRQIVASGENGTLEWDAIKQTVSLAIPASDLRTICSSQTKQELFEAQGQAFVNALRGERDPRMATGEDGVRALAVCDAARRASETRREEPVEYL